VADLLTVPEDYRQAIATALGRRAQYVVVDTAATGRRLIDYTRRHKAWVTVLPLDLLNPRTSNTPNGLLNSAGVIGLASSVVGSEPRFRVVVEQLLNNVLLVETLDVAIALARRYRRRPRFVTISGDSLEPSGAMSGGRAPVTVNVLGAAQELEQAERFAQKATAVADEARKRLQSCAVSYERAQEAEREIAASLALAQRQYSTVREEYAASKRVATQQQQQRKRLEEALGALTPPKCSVSDHEVGKAEMDLAANQRRLDHAIAQTQKLQQGHQRAQQSVLIYQEQAKHYQQAFKQHQSDLQRLGILDRQIDTLETTLQETRAQLEVALHAEKDAENALPTDLEDKESQVKQAEGTTFALENRLSDLTAEQATRSQEAERTRLSLARRETSFEVAAEDLKLYPAGLEMHPGTERSVRQGLQAVTAELDSLGPVNHLATREYQDLKDQYQKLEREGEQALQAANELEAVLERLDAEINSRLRNALMALRSTFRRYAEELFDGQVTADIEVETEQGRPVGMLIKLQPPGKRTPDLRLLSVGERTMGALAFLFALMDDGGLPIAVLDEVDAPLDEINIRRYCKFLMRLAESGTQFILITHQKATLEAADVLWGVTTDGGASRLFSIRKDESTDDAVLAN
jgi:chromosome segregation protein